MSNLVFIEDKIINKYKIINIKFFEKEFYKNEKDICIKFIVHKSKLDILFYKKELEEKTEYIKGDNYFEDYYDRGGYYNYTSITIGYDENILDDIVNIFNKFKLFMKVKNIMTIIRYDGWYVGFKEIINFFEVAGFKKNILYGANIYLDPIKSIETDYSYNEENCTDRTRGTITKPGFFGNKKENIDIWTDHSEYILNNKTSNYNYLCIELEPKYSSKEEILNYFK